MYLEAVNRKPDLILTVTKLLRPQINVTEAYSDLRQETLFRYEKLKTIYGHFSSIVIDEQAIEKLKKASDIQQLIGHERDIAMLFFKLPDLKLLLDENFNTSLATWTSIEAVKIKEVVDLDNLESSFSSWSNDFSYQKTLNDDLGRCESIYKELAATRPSTDQINHFKTNAEDIKNKSVQVASEIINDDSVLNDLKNITFSFPLTWEQEKNLFFTKLDRLTSEDQSSVDKLKKLDEFSKLVVLKAVLNKSYGETPRFNLCGEINVAAHAKVHDFSIIGQGLINVSAFTVSNPEVGVGILAHEIGHALTGSFLNYSNKADGRLLKDERLCVRDRNPNFNGLNDKTNSAFPFFEFDSLWSEEDFADYFSSRVTKNLKVKNFSCALLQMKDGVYLTDQMSLEPKSGDPHSSGLLRLLESSRDLKAIPSECAELVSKLKSNPVCNF